MITNANAKKTHCPRGHSYNAENTKFDKNKKGSISRKCKACISIRLKKKYINDTRAKKIKNPDREYRPMNIKHGEFGIRLYRIWNHLKSRCLNENNPDYIDWGGRGISVCDDWLEYENFAKWARSNGYSDSLTIDRIDNSGNYEPSNCWWATPKQQANNTRRNRLIEYRGTIMTLQQWSEKLDIKRETIAYRLNKGWDIEKALTTGAN